MISNFPQTIQTSIVENFFFGEADAKDDSQLEMCHVPTSAISDFLENQKDIVLGYRGAGKSAMVRLVEKKIFQFKESDNASHIIVVLDEEYDYRTIQNHLQTNILKNQKQIDVIRAVWEILIAYKIMLALKEDINDDDHTLRTYITEIEVILGFTEPKVGLINIILSHKKKIGIKIDTFHPNIIDTYIGIEPTNNATESTGIEILRIGTYKKYLDRLLKERNKKIYILVDRLDEFAINDDYVTQKMLLQELLSIQRTYREKYQRIKLKLFFRTDLFEQLDFNSLGADKIQSRSITLSWQPTDIKRFIAQRIGVNLLKSLEMDGFNFNIDADSYFVLSKDLSLLKESKAIRNFDIFKKSNWSKLKFYWKVIARKYQPNAGRLTNSMDLVHADIITSIFPKEIDHKKISGENQTIELFKFLDTHLQFSHKQTTPRAVLVFLNLCLQRVKQYYKDNPEIKEITRDIDGNFPLFLKVSILQAYEDFHLQSWKVQYQFAKEWRPLVGTIEKFAPIGNFSFREFKKKSNVDDVKARQFLAFSTHTGLVRCKNDSDRLEDRLYELPILFRKCSTICT